MKTQAQLERSTDRERALQRGDLAKPSLTDIKTGFRVEDGQALVLLVLSMFVLMGFLGMAIDVGHLRSAEHRLQAVADATALAGAIQISYCDGTALCPDMLVAAQNAGTENGFSTTASNFLTAHCTIPASTFSGNVLVINNGPCLAGSADPNKSNTEAVETLAQEDVPVYFAGLVGLKNPVRITARAEAGLGTYGVCVFARNVQIGTGGKFNAPCGIQVDGNVTSQQGGSACNGSQVTAAEGFNVSGTSCSSNQMNPAATTGAPLLPDPLQYLTNNSLAPATGSCGTLPWNATPGQTTKSPGSGQTYTMSPGTYCANSSGVAMEINSGDTVNLQAGTYVFTGSVQLDSNATLSGYPDATSTYGYDTNTLYFTAGTLNVNETNASVNLYAPTSTCSQNSLGGILLWMAFGNTSTFNLVNGAKNIYTGAIYAPSGTIDIKSGSSLGLYTLFDANTIVLGDGGTTNVNDNYSSLSCSSPFKEATAVLVE